MAKFIFIASASFEGDAFRFPPHMLSGTVYGPLDDDAAVEKAIQRLYPNNKSQKFLILEGEIVTVRPLPLEKPEHEKREPGDFNNYEKQPDGKHKCKTCGAQIMAAKVAHPVYLRAMPWSGSGECRYKDVPYCPHCEKKPGFYGDPVYV